VQQQLAALANSPYGSSATLLRSSLQDHLKEDIFKPVSPLAQRPYIAEATSPQKCATSPMSAAAALATSSAMAASHFLSSSSGSNSSGIDFKGGLSQPMRVTPKPLAQISLNSKKQQQDLFEGLEDEETPCFVPRKNIKKLLFKPSSSQHQQQHGPAESAGSRRGSSSTNSSVNGDIQQQQQQRSVSSNNATKAVPFYQDESINYNLPRGGGGGGGNMNNTTFGTYTIGQITNDLSEEAVDDVALNRTNKVIYFLFIFLTFARNGK
jgi:hypothetical protein